MDPDLLGEAEDVEAAPQTRMWLDGRRGEMTSLDGSLERLLLLLLPLSCCWRQQVMFRHRMATWEGVLNGKLIIQSRGKDISLSLS